MRVDFNNVRRQALYRYDDLTEKLNQSIIRTDDEWARPNDVRHGQSINLKGYVVIDAEDLHKVMSELRRLIGIIALCHEKDDPECADVYSEVYPEDTEKRMAIFNPEIELESNQ